MCTERVVEHSELFSLRVVQSGCNLEHDAFDHLVLQTISVLPILLILRVDMILLKLYSPDIVQWFMEP